MILNNRIKYEILERILELKYNFFNTYQWKTNYILFI